MEGWKGGAKGWGWVFSEQEESRGLGTGGFLKDLYQKLGWGMGGGRRGYSPPDWFNQCSDAGSWLPSLWTDSRQETTKKAGTKVSLYSWPSARIFPEQELSDPCLTWPVPLSHTLNAQHWEVGAGGSEFLLFLGYTMSSRSACDAWEHVSKNDLREGLIHTVYSIFPYSFTLFLTLVFNTDLKYNSHMTDFFFVHCLT